MHMIDYVSYMQHICYFYLGAVCDTLYSWFVILACSKIDLILWL